MQRHALEALARLVSGKAARKVIPAVLGCFASRDEAVRRAAIDAGIAFGDEAVTPVRQRLATATDTLERRALEEVLGRVGGKDAFSALLATLDTTDPEAARAAALAVRQRVKDATPARSRGTSRRSPSWCARSPRRKAPTRPWSRAGSRSSATWRIPPRRRRCSRSRATRQPARVREEAIVALRFTARGKAGAGVASALIELAERAPAELARPALYTMASLDFRARWSGGYRSWRWRRRPSGRCWRSSSWPRLPTPAAAAALAAC